MPNRREHFDAGHGNPRLTVRNIVPQREESKIRGEMIGESLWNAMESMMGGPGSYKSSLRLAATAHAHDKFPGEDIRFDEEDYPYLHVQVTPDIHAEYSIPHESSKPTDEDTDKEYFYADMYKTNRRGQKAALDALYIPGLARHDPAYIKDSAKEWVRETYKPNQEGYDRDAEGSYE